MYGVFRAMRGLRLRWLVTMAVAAAWFDQTTRESLDTAIKMMGNKNPITTCVVFDQHKVRSLLSVCSSPIIASAAACTGSSRILRSGPQVL